MTGGRLRPIAADVALAVAACVMDLTLYSAAPLRIDDPHFWSSVGYLVLIFAALLARRRRPAAVFVVVLALSVLAEPLTGVDFQPLVVVYLALFATAVGCRKEVAAAALAGALACAVRLAFEDVHVGNLEELVVEVVAGVYLMVLPLSVWAAGRWVRISREHAKDLEARRELEARQAVVEERARIARELHDIVSHAVTVMVLQAAGGRRVLRRDPARAERVLDTIGQVGEEAMGELRRMLGLLRTDWPVGSGGRGRPGGSGGAAGSGAADGSGTPGGADGPDESGTPGGSGAAGEAGAPGEAGGAPGSGRSGGLPDPGDVPDPLGPGEFDGPCSGVADLPRLLDPVRAVGVDVALRVAGEPRAVAPGVDLAVYRVVQEGLTNVTKHAGAGASAEVRLTWSGDRVEVEVVDDGGEGEPRRGLSTGHGLSGLRQRLAVLGGDLTAGELHGGGFRLAAVLPVADRLVASG
ncbi:histidine kinase [Saccharothrix sp. BKS2]|uniref:sensor histidine kinase n=1 Tax=Saccharothrix sp. BKS2 TaxID=3064400 RepID=UPI0039EBB4C3